MVTDGRSHQSRPKRAGPTSDSERSMITLDAGEVLMVPYAFADNSDVTRALDFAGDCLKADCAATDVETAIVTGGPSGLK